MPHGTADSRAGRFTQKPHGGALKSVQMPHPRTTQKLHFLRQNGALFSMRLELILI